MDSNQQPKRTSFLGAFKDKIKRSSSNASQKSVNIDYSAPPPQAATVSPVGPSGNRGTQWGTAADFSTNPFSNPSPATRRPRNDPPPAYAEATGAAGPGPGSEPAAIPSVVPTAPSPAYAPRDPSPSPSQISRLSGISISTPEDPYAFLSSFDTVFLIDDSGSMAGKSWREVQSALASITPICTAHDKDGIDIYFLNHRTSAAADPRSGKAAGGYTNITDATAIDRIFTTVRPSGMTPTGTRLNHILKAYLRRYETAIQQAGGDPDGTDLKPINLIMVTDGVPSDDPESVLLSVAQKLDKLEAPPHQVGVQFFQVGNEPGAKDALRALDDELSDLGGGVRDMVDTVTFGSRPGSREIPVLNADGILKTVLGAVVKRLDRARIQEEERRSQRSGLLRP